MNTALLRSVTDMEIKEAVLSIGSDKAPGHDRFTASFYQGFWEDIRADLCSMVKFFFDTGIMEPGINHTQLCLIPKPAGGDTFADYRPISLCTIMVMSNQHEESVKVTPYHHIFFYSVPKHYPRCSFRLNPKRSLQELL
ncbi:unnamed protein product [Microthlaspi erraticum]|uniref:Reverse transcriptase domain-containing protein n=1 Tax=Microthlaspi erraticum TaxID=1685480 RepID=A0A6D2HP89_9BRAS|nr:unnamed protein product [Microthlaspi erraticum]